MVTTLNSTRAEYQAHALAEYQDATEEAYAAVDALLAAAEAAVIKLNMVPLIMEAEGNPFRSPIGQAISDSCEYLRDYIDKEGAGSSFKFHSVAHELDTLRRLGKLGIDVYEEDAANEVEV